MNRCQFDLDLERWHKGNARQAAAARAGLDRRPWAEAGKVAGRGRAASLRWPAAEPSGGSRRPPPFPQQPRESASVLLSRNEIIGLTPRSIPFSPNIGNKAAV